MCAYDYGKYGERNEGDSICGKIQSRVHYFYRNLTVNFTNITDYSIQLDKVIKTL